MNSILLLQTQQLINSRIGAGSSILTRLSIKAKFLAFVKVLHLVRLLCNRGV